MSSRYTCSDAGRRGGHLAAAVVVAAVAAMGSIAAVAPASAWASPGDDHADEYREAYVAGVSLFEGERWAEARAAFQRAYELQPKPVLLFNIASTYRREGDDSNALFYYLRYLDAADEDDAYRAVARREVARLEARGARAPASGAGADAAGAAGTADDRGASGAGRGLKIGGVALAVAGGLANGLGVYETQQAGSIAAEISALPVGTEWSAELQARFDDGQAAQTRGAIALATGGAAVLAGAVSYWIGSRAASRAHHERGVAVTPYRSSDAAGILVTGRF